MLKLKPQKINSGFTLIETLLAVGIMIVIFSLGLFFSFDFYRSYAFNSEEKTIVSVLQKARSQSLSNINQTKHGVRFQENPLSYVLFQGEEYNENDPKNILIKASYETVIITPALPFDIIFDQLNGSCTNCQTPETIITISANEKIHDISINRQGRISW